MLCCMLGDKAETEKSPDIGRLFDRPLSVGE
jgi:hypothetical protein